MGWSRFYLGLWKDACIIPCDEARVEMIKCCLILLWLKGDGKGNITPEHESWKTKAENGKVHIRVMVWETEPNFLFQPASGRALPAFPELST